MEIDEQLFGKVFDAVEVDLIERPIDNSTAKMTPKGFDIKISPNSIASVKLKLGR